uniref:Uncharacterized protein n=1 Tax=Anguilla anguilla TaxID=7936 RepID=A0A0E9UTH8_ANGAN
MNINNGSTRSGKDIVVAHALIQYANLHTISASLLAGVLLRVNEHFWPLTVQNNRNKTHFKDVLVLLVFHTHTHTHIIYICIYI